MPGYPSPFPYDLLDASPDDDPPTLRKRWGQAMIKRRNQAVEVGRAFNELLDLGSRLGYDILMIAGIATPAEVSALAATLDKPLPLPDPAEPPPITLAFTALAGDPAEHYRPVQSRSLSLAPSKRFAGLSADALGVVFDR